MSSASKQLKLYSTTDSNISIKVTLEFMLAGLMYLFSHNPDFTQVLQIV